MEWGADLEVSLPALFTSLLVHGGGAVEDEKAPELFDSENDNDIDTIHRRAEADRFRSPNATKSYPQQATDKVLSAILQQPSPKDLSKTGLEFHDDETEEIPEDDDNLSFGDASEEESAHLSIPSSPEPSESSSVSSSCPSPLATPLTAYLPCPLLPLGQRRVRATPGSGVEGGPWLLADAPQPYFGQVTEAIEFAETASIEELVTAFVETVLDLLLGHAGASARIGGESSGMPY